MKIEIRNKISEIKKIANEKLNELYSIHLKTIQHNLYYIETRVLKLSPFNIYQIYKHHNSL